MVNSILIEIDYQNASHQVSLYSILSDDNASVQIFSQLVETDISGQGTLQLIVDKTSSVGSTAIERLRIVIFDAHTSLPIGEEFSMNITEIRVMDYQDEPYGLIAPLLPFTRTFDTFLKPLKPFDVFATSSSVQAIVDLNTNSLAVTVEDIDPDNTGETWLQWQLRTNSLQPFPVMVNSILIEIDYQNASHQVNFRGRVTIPSSGIASSQLVETDISGQGTLQLIVDAPSYPVDLGTFILVDLFDDFANFPTNEPFTINITEIRVIPQIPSPTSFSFTRTFDSELGSLDTQDAVEFTNQFGSGTVGVNLSTNALEVSVQDFDGDNTFDGALWAWRSVNIPENSPSGFFTETNQLVNLDGATNILVEIDYNQASHFVEIYGVIWAQSGGVITQVPAQIESQSGTLEISITVADFLGGFGGNLPFHHVGQIGLRMYDFLTNIPDNEPFTINITEIRISTQPAQP
jgi:hypothetical protein